jgi:hypothetical protein
LTLTGDIEMGITPGSEENNELEKLLSPQSGLSNNISGK